MTDRVHTLTVVLDHDMRVDDVESLMSAIRHMRHVGHVTGLVANHDSHMAQVRAKLEIRERLLDEIEALFKDKA